MSRLSIWFSAVAAMGCSSPTAPPSSAKTPASGASTPATTNEDDIIEGTITAIELHNINKALDHYTYNVDLVVDRAGAEPIRVRVDKIYWGRLRPARQGELAPEGPAQKLTPKHYEPWTVGDPVSLAVEITSPGLARLASSTARPD